MVKAIGINGISSEILSNGRDLVAVWRWKYQMVRGGQLLCFCIKVVRMNVMITEG